MLRKKVKSSQSNVFSTARQYRHVSLLHGWWRGSRSGGEDASPCDEDDVDGDGCGWPGLSSTSRPVVARRYTRETRFHARHSMTRRANNDGSTRSIIRTRRSSPSTTTATAVLMLMTATAMVVQRVPATTRWSSSCSLSSSSSGLRSASRSECYSSSMAKRSPSTRESDDNCAS